MPPLYPLEPSVAQSLAQRRRALGWSQNDLAIAAALTEGAIAKYETLRCRIPPGKRAAMECALAQAEAGHVSHLDNQRQSDDGLYVPAAGADAGDDGRAAPQVPVQPAVEEGEDDPWLEDLK